MKTFSAILVLSVSASAFAAQKPHLDPQATSAEYRSVLAKQAKTKTFSKSMNEDSDASIEFSIKLGERLAKWVTKINETRTAETAIRLTSPETRISYPIDKPNMYNPEILAKEAEALKISMPRAMVDVIWGSADLPADTAGIDDKTFASQGRLLDRNYQGAARYKSLNPWREDYKWQAALDVRG